MKNWLAGKLGGEGKEDQVVREYVKHLRTKKTGYHRADKK